MPNKVQTSKIYEMIRGLGQSGLGSTVRITGVEKPGNWTFHSFQAIRHPVVGSPLYFT